jgi:hypothetical protein
MLSVSIVAGWLARPRAAWPVRPGQRRQLNCVIIRSGGSGLPERLEGQPARGDTSRAAGAPHDHFPPRTCLSRGDGEPGAVTAAPSTASRHQGLLSPLVAGFTVSGPGSPPV